jgi:hypothetical protein
MFNFHRQKHVVELVMSSPSQYLQNFSKLVYQVSYKQLACNFKGMFGIVVAVVIQSVFRLKIYQNKKNNFLKIIFNISTSKR